MCVTNIILLTTFGSPLRAHLHPPTRARTGTRTESFTQLVCSPLTRPKTTQQKTLINENPQNSLSRWRWEHACRLLSHFWGITKSLYVFVLLFIRAPFSSITKYIGKRHERRTSANIFLHPVETKSIYSHTHTHSHIYVTLCYRFVTRNIFWRDQQNNSNQNQNNIMKIVYQLYCKYLQIHT